MLQRFCLVLVTFIKNLLFSRLVESKSKLLELLESDESKDFASMKLIFGLSFAFMRKESEEQALQDSSFALLMRGFTRQSLQGPHSLTFARG